MGIKVYWGSNCHSCFSGGEEQNGRNASGCCMTVSRVGVFELIRTVWISQELGAPAHSSWPLGSLREVPGKQNNTMEDSWGVLSLGSCFPNNDHFVYLVRVLLFKTVSSTVSFWEPTLDPIRTCPCNKGPLYQFDTCEMRPSLALPKNLQNQPPKGKPSRVDTELRMEGSNVGSWQIGPSQHPGSISLLGWNMRHFP